jgi:glycosyltransferase involved in cell wall biosynthesis
MELGYVQPDLLYQIMGAVDIGLMNLTKDGVREAGPVTTRFATYASFKIPVIANDTYMEYYADELEQGLAIVPPEDPQALEDIILWLYNHPDERRKKAEILHDFVINNLTWESVTEKILDIIRGERKSRKKGYV